MVMLPASPSTRIYTATMMTRPETCIITVLATEESRVTANWHATQYTYFWIYNKNTTYIWEDVCVVASWSKKYAYIVINQRTEINIVHSKNYTDVRALLFWFGLVFVWSTNVQRGFSDDKSTLIQVMALCHQATSYYLSQCWPVYQYRTCAIPKSQQIKVGHIDKQEEIVQNKTI